MEVAIENMIDEWWSPRAASLRKKVQETVQSLEEFLEREADDPRKETRLREALGEFGAERIDAERLSKVVEAGHANQHQDADRLARMRASLKTLRQARPDVEYRPVFARMETDTDPEKLIALFDDSMQRYSILFKTLRLAALDLQARYRPDVHAAFFDRFDWRELDEHEFELCPPFVVFARPPEEWGRFVGALTNLLSRGRPVKLFEIQSNSPLNHFDHGRSTALRIYPDFAFFALALRGVFVARRLEPANGTGVMNEAITRAVESPRSALISLWAEPLDPEREKLARASRAFPNFTFDPDAGMDFADGLDLSDNPEPRSTWGRMEDDRVATFADFAAGEEAYREDFTTLAAGEPGPDHLPLLEFLELAPAERAGRIPFIVRDNSENHETFLRPSEAIIDRTVDRARRWRTLQVLAGIATAEDSAPDSTVRPGETGPAARAQAPDADARANIEHQALQRGVSNIIAGLLGRSPNFPKTGAETARTEQSPGASATGDEAAASHGGPWIETELCTACDECTTLNRAIFAYNNNKQAVIRNPRGGPFRDIVKAAERCTAGIIHPGDPLDPKEKDLERWMKRAEKFNRANASSAST